MEFINQKKADIVQAATASAPASGGDDGASGSSFKGWAANQEGAKTLKLVITGNSAVGKSCLITNFLNNSFTEDYEPTLLDVFRG